MSSSVRRAAILALVALLTCAAAAFAAGAKKGATYTGKTVQGKEPITLKVSHKGKAVTVSVLFAPLYCEGGGAGERQLTKPAPIAADGSFKATITYEFAPTRMKTDRLYVSGKFSGKKVKGSARSEFGLSATTPQARANLKACDGSTSFSATTK
ncbi:MAG: hypothetical protein ACYDHT_13725 [Solirubrobacteraceae bacterium]